jgi:hypothetical protein
LPAHRLLQGDAFVFSIGSLQSINFLLCACWLLGFGSLIDIGQVACLLAAGFILVIDYLVCIGLVLSPVVEVVEDSPAWLTDRTNVAGYDWRRGCGVGGLGEARFWELLAEAGTRELLAPAGTPELTTWSWRRHLNLRLEELEIWNMDSREVLRRSMKW